jgi:hypothetical protein
VLLEELAFRGVLFGMLQTIVSQNYAHYCYLQLVLGFGTYLVLALLAYECFASELFLKLLIITGGSCSDNFSRCMFLTWTRIKSGSLITPILIHWTINATGMLYCPILLGKNNST